MALAAGLQGIARRGAVRPRHGRADWPARDRSSRHAAAARQIRRAAATRRPRSRRTRSQRPLRSMLARASSASAASRSTSVTSRMRAVAAPRPGPRPRRRRRRRAPARRQPATSATPPAARHRCRRDSRSCGCRMLRRPAEEGVVGQRRRRWRRRHRSSAACSPSLTSQASRPACVKRLARSRPIVRHRPAAGAERRRSSLRAR